DLENPKPGGERIGLHIDLRQTVKSQLCGRKRLRSTGEYTGIADSQRGIGNPTRGIVDSYKAVVRNPRTASRINFERRVKVMWCCALGSAHLQHQPRGIRRPWGRCEIWEAKANKETIGRRTDRQGECRGASPIAIGCAEGDAECPNRSR